MWLKLVSVDNATEELISKTIQEYVLLCRRNRFPGTRVWPIARREFRHNTILTIAHRLRTVINYDRVTLLPHLGEYSVLLVVFLRSWFLTKVQSSSLIGNFVFIYCVDVVLFDMISADRVLYSAILHPNFMASVKQLGARNLPFWVSGPGFDRLWSPCNSTYNHPHAYLLRDSLLPFELLYISGVPHSKQLTSFIWCASKVWDNVAEKSRSLHGCIRIRPVPTGRERYTTWIVYYLLYYTLVFPNDKEMEVCTAERAEDAHRKDRMFSTGLPM